MSRRGVRETVFKVLFQIDVGNNLPDFLGENWLEEETLTASEKIQVKEIIEKCLEHMGVIDGFIQKYLRGWNILRISGIDRSLLRLAVYEIKFEEDIPPVVSVNEAIELAKVYNGDDSAKFINGILDSVLKDKDSKS
ncbi:transcription antitermination factor NusB [Candidatus Contubernalis alkaliaceticus]|uniref:transcription antitermination factor NusB n=1 Tax=Candidatus Contubernalis alkaliaceticus TaxID=338645 RepID=UPI001F4BD4AC|nr:transcription antitermination factor NusB [Candidatus Contubernalis alkalaceticus]UNC92547.1 transcription antitermination factor NusB [Candidatus Contubernalis alkalaceticus]